MNLFRSRKLAAALAAVCAVAAARPDRAIAPAKPLRLPRLRLAVVPSVDAVAVPPLPPNSSPRVSSRDAISD